MKVLEDLEIYNLSQEFGELIWKKVQKWNEFEKSTLGKQLVRAADSIAANIAEGYGRYFYKETKQFLYYSRGSLLECKAWLFKASSRGLINSTEEKMLLDKLSEIHIKINAFINYVKSPIRSKQKQ